MLERPDLADNLANLQETAGIEFGVAPFHGFDVFGVRAPGFEGLFGSKPENRQFLAVLGLERFDL